MRTAPALLERGEVRFAVLPLERALDPKERHVVELVAVLVRLCTRALLDVLAHPVVPPFAAHIPMQMATVHQIPRRLTGRLPSPERLARLRVEDRIPAAKPTWAVAEKLVPREVRVVVVEPRVERDVEARDDLLRVALPGLGLVLDDGGRAVLGAGLIAAAPHAVHGIWIVSPTYSRPCSALRSHAPK